MQKLIASYSSIFLDIYLPLYLGSPLDHISEIHLLSELNQVQLLNHYKSDYSSRKIIKAIINEIRDDDIGMIK